VQNLASPPIPVSAEAGADVLAVESAQNEVLRLESLTGRLQWRYAVGEPFVLQPVLAENRVLVSAPSGKIVAIDAESGDSAGYVQLPQPVRVAPAVDLSRKLVYQVAEHSNLYVLGLDDFSCKAVFLLGHDVGSVTSAPAVVGGNLVLGVNDGAQDSSLRLFAIERGGGRQAGHHGQASAADSAQRPDRHHAGGRRKPRAGGDRSRRGEGVRPDADGERQSAQGNRRPFDRGERECRALRPFAGWPILHRRHPAQQIRRRRLEGAIGAEVDRGRKLRIPASADRRRSRRNHGAAEGQSAGRARCGHQNRGPGALVGDNRRRAAGGRSGAERSDEETRCRHGNGRTFELDAANLKSQPVLDAPVVSIEPADLQTPIGAITALDKGAIAVAAAQGAPRVNVFDPSDAPPRYRWLGLSDKSACPPIGIAGGIAVPTEGGAIFLLDPLSGKPLAAPFQARLDNGVKPVWQKPAACGKQEFVIADGKTTLYHIGVADKPKPHLAALEQVEAASEPASRRRSWATRRLSPARRRRWACSKCRNLNVSTNTSFRAAPRGTGGNRQLRVVGDRRRPTVVL